MAVKNVAYQSLDYLNIPPCATVNVCLSAVWADRTVSGLTTVSGILNNAHRDLAGIVQWGSYDPRGSKRMQYDLLIDDTLFITNPGTGLPWLPCETDILSVTACV